jgi:hypothetical protein
MQIVIIIAYIIAYDETTLAKYEATQEVTYLPEIQQAAETLHAAFPYLKSSLYVAEVLPK